MRSKSTALLFLFVLVLTGFSVMAVWPSEPGRYIRFLPSDLLPEGRGIKIGDWERETMRLGLDLRGGAFVVLQADPPEGYQGNVADALEGAKSVIERRVNTLGVSEAEITTASGDRIQVAIPGLNLQDAQDLVGKTAQLEFRVYNDLGEVVPAAADPNSNQNCLLPAGTPLPEGCKVMDGSMLKQNTSPARQGTDFVVQFETTGEGSKILEKITSRALSYRASGDNRNLLMVFLDEEMISAPGVNGVISDAGVITGQRSFTEAKRFSDLLNDGALPVPLKTVQASEVSASLGEDSVQDSVTAGQVGLLAVALFMILYYRLPGVLAALALGVYTSVTLMVFKMVPVTLTLSGIAAFILSVGMAVDANILIFERMKEELRRGRSLNVAIDLGFKRAWTSIQDSNIATFITCAILFWFGDQFGAALVKGFALTLALGVAVSMFSAITVTRTFLKMVVGTRIAKNGWLWNATEVRRRPAAALSADAQEGKA